MSDLIYTLSDFGWFKVIASVAVIGLFILCFTGKKGGSGSSSSQNTTSTTTSTTPNPPTNNTTGV